MKKNLTLICAVLITHISYSQYVRFPLDSAIWRVDYYNSSGCLPGPQPNGTFQYTFQGDSILNSLTYSQIYSSGISNCLSFGFCGLLRDDTVAKKVYFVFPGTANELVMYDFNLSVGDTIHDIYNNFPLNFNLVDSIDNIILGGVSRKRIRYTQNIGGNYPYIIEGMGNVAGLMAPLEDVGELYDLTCFSYKGISIYPTSSSNCSLINEVENSFEDQNKISIVPMPVSSQSVIEYSGTEILEVRILDIYGRIQERIFSKDNLFSLSAEKLTNGIYFVFLISIDNAISKKEILISK